MRGDADRQTTTRQIVVSGWARKGTGRVVTQLTDGLRSRAEGTVGVKTNATHTWSTTRQVSKGVKEQSSDVSVCTICGTRGQWQTKCSEKYSQLTAHMSVSGRHTQTDSLHTKEET